MRLTYTSALTVQPRRVPFRRRSQWTRSVGVLVVASAAACATGGGSAIPRGAPRLAEGSTPEPVRFEVVVAGPRGVARIRVTRVLNDSLFHVNGGDAATLSAYNLARLTKVRVEVVPAGKDSMRVALTGETYIGDTTRLDSISGLPERWRLITASDPAAALLRGLARALRPTRAPRLTEPGGGPAPASSGGSSAPVRTAVDSTPVAALAATPVGRAVNVCRTTAVPPGWLILYWYTDAKRCTALADERYRGEPNAMRLEREW